MEIINHGRYSRDDSLTEIVAPVILLLLYVDPSLFLPFVASGSYLALETMAATQTLGTKWYCE